METNPQPQSEENKLRQRLEDCLHHARELEDAMRAPADLPRIDDEPAGVARASHESLLPGSILTTLFRSPKTGRTVSFKREELAELDGMTADYLLNYYQSQSLFTPDDAARLRACIEGSARRYHQLLRHSDWRAQVFGYDTAHEQALLRALLQLRLLVECAEILTPPLLTVKRIDGVEFDLIDDLHDLNRLLIFSLWGRLAADAPELLAYGSLSICISGLAAKPDEAQALLESSYAASNGDAAAFLRWLDKGSGRKAMDQARNILREADKHGVDEILALLTRH
ncbi:MAG TPA: hypothetical protein VFC07_12375, partial [Verrucomicrobiae bacterium]|nr:hypothetical protein [Verrucomicrobiae bacterium]